jgi:hypothetical protein
MYQGKQSWNKWKSKSSYLGKMIVDADSINNQIEECGCEEEVS